MVEEGIPIIIHIARVISRKTEDISALPFQAVQLKLQIHGAAIVFDFHQVNNWFSISTRQILCIAREQGHLRIDKILNILCVRDCIELPYVYRHISSSVAPSQVNFANG